MRKVLIGALSAAMLIGMAGCAGPDEGNSASVTPDTSIVLTDDKVDKPLSGDQNGIGDNAGSTDIIASENPSEAASDVVPSDKPSDSKEPEQTNAVPGTWQTNSMVNAEDGSMGPTYHIQFTATEIKYGHMKDGTFVEEYSDKISHLEKTVEGKFVVQAESKNGVKYTFKTSESDADTMEYYGTWTEAEFASTYSATGSLTKVDSEAKG